MPHKCKSPQCVIPTRVGVNRATTIIIPSAILLSPHAWG